MDELKGPGRRVEATRWRKLLCAITAQTLQLRREGRLDQLVGQAKQYEGNAYISGLGGVLPRVRVRDVVASTWIKEFWGLHLM